MGQIEIMYHMIARNEKKAASVLWYSCPKAQPESNCENTSDKPRLRDILPYTWPVIFKVSKQLKEIEGRHEN